MALGAVELGLIALPWVIVLVALFLHWRDETEGYPDRMKAVEEVE